MSSKSNNLIKNLQVLKKRKKLSREAIMAKLKPYIQLKAAKKH